MAAGDDGTGLIYLVIAAPQQRVDRLLGQVFRHRHDIQRQLRLTAHGVDIRQGVGSGDLSEGIGVVVDGREKVHRLDQGQVLRHLVDRGVVGLIKAHQQIGVMMDPDAVQELGKNARPHLCAAAGAFCQFCQLNIFHNLYSSENRKIASSTPPPMARALSETS